MNLAWLKWILSFLQFIMPAISIADVKSGPDFLEMLVEPKIFHGSDAREMATSKKGQDDISHVHDLTIKLTLWNKTQIWDLQLNRFLISDRYFVKHQTFNDSDSYILNNPEKHEIELCHYQGRIRDVPQSLIAVSTCDGIRGTIFDGEKSYFIQSLGNETRVLYQKWNEKKEKTNRAKRSTGKVREPHNANRQSRYIELVLVVDNREYKSLDEDVLKVRRKAKDIANIINGLYAPLNIFVALVGVIVWTQKDEISIDADGDKTLTNFLLYRRQKLIKEHANDNAQLITKLQFKDGIVGKALKGPICTYEFSGGVNMDHSEVIGVVAATVAHEMGHNLGMEHDTTDCACAGDQCIMSPSSSSYTATQWSNCSVEYLALAFEHGMDYCLRNKPKSIFDGPVCGNGFVENGESCDCGLSRVCDNPCCNAATCMLKGNATCATGKCCNLQTCSLQPAGTKCRPLDHECDLPEYCTGSSEYCPENIFKIDGETCQEGKAFCYQGNCRSRDDQCRMLWGPSGTSSDARCYELNMKGTRHGHCGRDRLNNSYIKCDNPDAECGLLQCRHLNEKLEFGIESAADISEYFVNNGGNIIPCRTASVDLGLSETDPGLVPDGSKCGDNSMCLNQKCISVKILKSSQNCNGHGVYNSKGHCHCDDGFAPPTCEYPGVGGSEESGPAMDPNGGKAVRIALYCILITCFLAFLLLFLHAFYKRRRSGNFWNARPAPKRVVSVSMPCEKAPPEMDVGPAAAAIQRLLINSSIDNKIPTDITAFQKDLIGDFKGFSIRPLQQIELVSVPVRPAPPAPNVSRPIRPEEAIAAAFPVRPAPLVPVRDAIPVATVKPTMKLRTAPDVPADRQWKRPQIGPPVLAETTSTTAKHLLKPSLKLTEESVSKVEEKPPPSIKREKSFKAAKIERERLKGLEISAPILRETSLSPDEGRNSLSRAQSVRFKGKERRPLHSYSSMRLPKRPSSVPACRPKSPPPQPPKKEVKPVTNLEEAEENIYATIEEEEGAENPGLLDEIVSEIRARNSAVYSSQSTSPDCESGEVSYLEPTPSARAASPPPVMAVPEQTAPKQPPKKASQPKPGNVASIRNKLQARLNFNGNT